MQLLLDNLTATIIASVIVLMMMVVKLRGQETLAETTAFYAMTKQGETFAKVVRRDMQGLADVYTVEEDPADSTFRFKGRVGNDPTLYDITYRREWVKSRDGVDFYQIKRLVDGQPAGNSGPIVTDWEIQALNKDGLPITDPSKTADCRQVYVQVEVASSFFETETVKRVNWESTFYPPLRNQMQML